MNHSQKVALDLREHSVINLVGNPNVGKSVIFGLLTGRYVVVSNYPGTTVEITRGHSRLGNGGALVVDTPGTNSLIPGSEDEKVARDMLFEEGKKTVIQVADAKNLRRALLLSTQLAEMQIPFVLDLNMWDESMDRGIDIHVDMLEELTGVPVVCTVATQRRGIRALADAVPHARPSILKVDFGNEIEGAIAEIEDILPPMEVASRSVAVMLLAGDRALERRLDEKLDDDIIEQIGTIRRRTQKLSTDPLGYAISCKRMAFVDSMLFDVMEIAEKPRRASIAVTLGNICMHPILGLPILLAVLVAIYYVVGVFGAGTCVDFLESTVFGEYLIPWSKAAVDFLLPIPLLQEMLMGEYGLISVGLTYALAIVFPVVGFFFFLFGILEDSGYLPRIGVMADRIFRKIGLSGKAVLPMVTGLGCGTMATLTARILDTRKERIIAILLLALGIPCSAQLGVVMGILGAISMNAFFIYVAVIAFQLLFVGFLASKVIPGESSDFLMEIPPFRLPRIRNVVTKTVFRIQWFLKEAVPLFLLGTFVLFLADKLRVLSAIERVCRPVVSNVLGLPVETTKAFIMGFLRRDYGAAGLMDMARDDIINSHQVIVSMVVITLFVPCIASLFVIIKEQGLKVALCMLAFVFPYAIVVGGVLHHVMNALGY